jgi:ubiquinone/menaquinone biosynthesis C-methylase UbiE
MTPELSSVGRAQLRPGEIVLDVCSAAGGAAMAAARAVGPEGRVIGLETDPALLAVARAAAVSEGAANLEFRQAHFDQVYFRAGSFDAIICCFGLAGFPSPRATVQKMWRFLRPGGRLVIAARGSDEVHAAFPEAEVQSEDGIFYAVGAKSV